MSFTAINASLSVPDCKKTKKEKRLSPVFNKRVRIAKKKIFKKRKEKKRAKRENNGMEDRWREEKRRGKIGEKEGMKRVLSSHLCWQLS